METKEWLAIGALVILALYIGRQSNKYFAIGNTATEAPATDDEPEQAPVIANGQAYYNIHLNLSGTAYNNLSNEYLPLFGFVGIRSY